VLLLSTALHSNLRFPRTQPLALPVRRPLKNQLNGNAGQKKLVTQNEKNGSLYIDPDRAEDPD
jgi:hypothetical protein